MTRPHLLLIEDDDALREVLSFNLEDAGFRISAAARGQAGLDVYDPDAHDLVITDIRMPDLSGLQVLSAILERDPLAVVLVMTAFGGTERALEAMRAGAFHYIEKPINTGALVAILDKALELRRTRRENARLRDVTRRPHAIIAASQRMSDVLRRIDKVAPTDATVLITGESGTGKELVARTLHQRSERRDHPFVAINCAAIPAELLESTLFGHARGAFTGAHRDSPGTFQRAHRGTLFLDEIAELPFALQAKLLRVLQDGEVLPVGAREATRVDVRILAATHRDLDARIAEGAFREDLYWRLNVVPIEIPPLRERPEDVPVLTRFFLRKHAPGDDIGVSREADEALIRHTWPGNVRELENTLQRMLILRESDTLGLRDVPARLRSSRQNLSGDASLPFTLPEEGLDLRALERAVILAALERHDGNQSATARYLRIPRHVLTYRLDKYASE